MSYVETYISNLEIPPGNRLESLAEAPAEIGLAVATGSNLLEFAPATSAPRRAAVANSVLLAQLAANRASLVATPQQWYEAHNSVLTNLGWSATSFDIIEHEFDNTQAELHSAIIPVITAAFAPGVALPGLIVETLKQLDTMDKSSWIGLFDRESRRFKAQQFQISYSDGDANEQRLNCIGFNLEVMRESDQIAFLRGASEAARFQRLEGQFAISLPLLDHIESDLAAKLRGHVGDYLKSIEI